ncbi:FAD-dependent oxidoreductase [Candidatus Rhabdochlamydia sp. T3358]|uniref:FAD-dependent oxidoreductase n=1 Tax=Candidatus Rhabdochlamydia sp. T3358 TaxID=2099795 RepID=UPI0010B12AAC|nr:FAD-dependent oxidoreductase [Candidatus Rhabdochlamydia sp. T3358]VHO02400.1 bifunctional tRNA (mnm(5)s(2)U34)-methyltransferase/FAD-dependent cmnm(5)s(2)U34 oxidoreductase [Candidatus Rhabdochlamydia sp. T3358]
MRIAIIGAGFSGLAAAWNLLNLKNQVVVFDLFSGGASAVAAGLLHPYVGEEGRRSLFATEAMQKTEELLQIAKASLREEVYREGIIRIAQNEKQRKAYKNHCVVFKDVVDLGKDHFLIKSGKTVFCKRYLQGMRLAIAERGGQFIAEKITDLKQLKDFDQIVVAAGASIRNFPEFEQLKLRFIKGQVLTCEIPLDLQIEKSLVGKGYIATSYEPKICHVGATYERHDLTDTADLLNTQNLLFTKASSFYPDIWRLKPIDCSSAIRVKRQGHYLPMVKEVSSRVWVITAMGSRGLLYHAYFGEKLAQAIQGMITLSFQELMHYLK